MPDISTYLKQAEELDKKRGISSNPSVMPAVTPGGTVTQTAGPDISAYLAQAEKLDRERSAAPTTTPNTTRADGAGVGGNGYEIQMPKLEVELPQIRAFGAADYPAPNLKRIGNVLAAAGTGAAAGFVETAGQLTQPQGLTIGESARVALQGGTRAQEQAAEQEKAQRIRENIKDPLYATADRLTEQSAAYTEKAKEGLGKVGQFAVDLGVTGTQLLGDMALGLINPVLGTGAMATRVFGGSAQEARQAGATETEQQLYGLGSAATSVLVEKIANVGKAFKTAYGGSIAGGKVDDILTKLTGKLMKNPAGQRILASAAGEAGEEGLEALLQPALQAIYDKGATLNKTWFGSTEELTDYLTDVGYNALLGGALGALGGGGNVAAPATTQTAQGGEEAAQKGQNAPMTGNETPAPAEGAQRPQNTPMSFENTAAADILMGAAPQKQRAGFTSLENAMANQFERETGISIESVESILGGLANGDYNSANWVARIAQDAKDPKMVVVAHELTHHLQTLAPQEYESFRTAVADYFTRAGGEAALTDMMNRYRSAYGAAGQNLSDSAVMDEMAADFTEVLLTDADLFGQFARENRTLAERLLDALRAFIEKIRATFTGRARNAAAQEATGKTLNELEMIAEQWQGVYRAAAAAYGQNANTATQEGDGVRYSIDAVGAAENNRKAAEHFGKTYKWAETGYLLLDGSKLDFSGKHNGAPGGYRTVDHRDIREALGWDYGGDSYSGGMVQFMQEGNIRIAPENGGINLSVRPTKAQESALDDFISRNRGEIMLDIDDANGNTVASVEYPRGTKASKVIADIQKYFKDGTVPQVSELAQFRYSLKDSKYLDAMAQLQNLPEEDRKIAQTAIGRVRHSDNQASMTDKRLDAVYSDYAYGKSDKTKGYLTYIDPYDFLSLTTSDVEAFLARNTNKLDEGVSGWGNKNNIRESGAMFLRVDEDGNVIGHEGRHRMAALYRAGYRKVAVAIDTGYTENAAPISILRLNGQDFGNSKSYATRYVHRLLPVTKKYESINRYVFGYDGRGFSEPQNMRFSLKTDSDGRQLSDGQKAYFANSKSVDAQGRLRVMYRGGNSNFTVFDRKKSSYANLYGRGFYFTDSKSHAEQYGGAREFYLNITNPVPTDEQTITREQLLNFLQAVAENEDDYSFENYGYGATPESMVDAIYSGKSDFAMLYDVSQTAIGDMVEAVELFNEINGTDFDGLILDTETVIFNSEQAKLTDNKTPTDNPDIRFSLKDKRVPTYEELIAKPDMTVVDISTPKTQGTFAERRKKIKETVPEVIKKPYLNRDTGTMIFLTKRSYTHAFNNNKELDINAAEHFPELIENAILTHAEPSTHGNENANGVYTFFAAARGKEDVPVKLKVKEIDVVGQEIPANVAAYFEKNPKEYAEAYDSVVLEVLEIEESPNGSGKDVNRNGSFLTPTGLRNIKVADFLSLVNGDESKYLPKSGNMAQLKSTAPLRQMMAEMPQQMMIRMPRLTTVEQDEAEAAGVEAAPVEDTVQLPQLGLTDADVPGTEPLTRQDIARELAWRARMANEPAAPQAMGEVKLPDLSEDMEEAGMGVADFTGNVETVPQEATAEILSALEDLSRDMETPMETPTDATVRDAESLISAETVEAPQSLKEKAAESWAFFKRKMVDSGEAVTQIGKAINDKYLYPFYNMARASASAGANMIAEEQTDVNGRTVGESLNAIFDPIRAKGEEYYTQFQTYMYDLHNIARMSMDQKAKQEQETAEAALAAYTADHPKFINMTEAQAQRQADSIDELEAEEAQEYLRLVRWVNRAARMGNKPVFDYDFTAEMSRGRSERLLREHPEFAQYREQVRKYIDNMMQYRVDSGLITQQDADFLREYYPDYIPTYRRQAFEDFGAAVKKKRVQIGKTVGRATGGNTKLVPLHEALGKQTMQVVREGSKNRFGARLLQDYTANASNADIARYVRNAEEYESDFSIDTFDSIDDVKPKRGNTFSVYLGGKLYDMTVDNALFEAVEALSPTATEQNTVTKVVHDVNKLYKALITGYNPTFAIRNTVRDLQTAGLYSRDFAAWAKNYPKALAEIKNDGPMWKQYKALGGDFSSVFDYMTGTVKKPTTKAGKVMDKVQALNMAMEQAPRLAEFMAVMESGDGSMESAMDAMLAAADVTVNFGRGGTWGKMLNANYVPFLNPGIQGFDKMVRYATQSRSGKQWLMMAARAAALGIAPSLINALLYHDDEEWEELRDSDKDTNYMFKLKDGLWLKIPKGRELSVLGIAADRVGDALQGEEVDIRATLNTMANQVAPANPLNQNILKAAYDTQLFDPSSPGRTWYGGDIEGQRLQNYAPEERYDSSTDVVSKAIGGALNLSPKKLNYLADQYTGVVGDIVLPLLTPQAERDMFSKAFTVDSISSNELSGKFYEKSDELTYAKNGGDAVAAVVSRYWNSISSDVSKLYGEIRDVENSDLSNREKKEQVQELQRQINAIQREALATVDQYTEAVESSLFGDDDDAADFAYRETNREVFGAKSALETYNKDVYAKAQEAAKNGVSYEAYYDYYFATKDIEGDKDASGKTIPGSKREKVLAEINAMDLTVEQKNALYYASGYAESTLYEAPWYTIQMPRL